MFRIGDFARLGQVSIKTLHHYDELGRLDPALARRVEHGLDLARLALSRRFMPQEVNRMPALHRTPALALIALTAVLSAASPARAVTLADRSRSDYRIVLAADAVAPEKTAAAELRQYLRQVTGADFPIVTEIEAGHGSRQILVGPSRRVKRLLPDVEWSKLGRDGIVIRTMGNLLILAGGRPRGTLYAVYTFLEDTVGCRWWTSAESTIPRRNTLRIPELNIVYTPKLLYREAYYQETNANPLFAARLKLNGHFPPIPEEYGGHYSVLGWCHTAYALLPPSTYFAAHPDWYAEQNGKRSADWGQLCFSSDEMRAELTRQALKWIRKNPDAGIISISQNDWIGNCQCEKCRAVDAEEGSPSGSLIRCVNKVAEEIEKQYPEMLIETLAYQYTRKPPLKARPRHNVVVRLCSIECNFGRPLDSDYNAAFRDDLKKWASMAPNLYIWDYVTDFASYIQPHPNMRTLAPNTRFFVENNTIGIFEQGNPGCTIGDMERMRAWLHAHLQWDPSRDDKALIREYLNGYYGAAGPYLRQYIDLLHDAFEKSSVYLGCGNRDLSFLTLPVMNEAADLFARAENAVAEDPALSARVRRERLALDHVWLMRYHELKAFAESNKLPFGGPKDPAELCREFVRLAHHWKNTNFSEAQSFDSYAAGLATSFEPIPTPEELERLPKERCVVIQQDEFTLHGAPHWVETVRDALASDGMAARMPGDHTNWAIQYAVPESLAGRGERWKCYVVLRGDPGESGCVFRIGIFNNNPYSELVTMGRDLGKAGGEKYQTLYLGTHRLTSAMYFWLSPVGNPAALRAVYVDRIALVKEE